MMEAQVFNLEVETDSVLMDRDLKAIGERLRSFRTQAKLTQGDIARESGEHQSIISDIERGYRRASVDLLAWAARRYHTTIDYLVFGEDTAKGGVTCSGERAVDLQRVSGNEHGLMTTLESIGHICIPERLFTESTFALEETGKGNEPVINPGAIVGIDQEQKALISGDFYLFNLREGYGIYRAFAGKQIMLLRKENSTYPEIQLPLQRVGPETIVGRVTWVFQRL